MEPRALLAVMMIVCQPLELLLPDSATFVMPSDIALVAVEASTDTSS